MKAVLKFDLDDPEDGQKLRRALHADDCYSALWKLREAMLFGHLNDGKPEEILTEALEEIELDSLYN